MFTLTQKQVTANVRKIDAKAITGAIQDALVQIIAHAMTYGHSPLANTLDERMTGQPMLAKLAKPVRQYLTSFGPFTYSDASGFVFSKARRDIIAEEYGVLEAFDDETFAAEAPSWTADRTASKGSTKVDLVKAVEALVKRAEKKTLSGECTDAGLIDYLRTALAGYSSAVALKAAMATVAAVAAEAKVEVVEAA